MRISRRELRGDQESPEWVLGRPSVTATRLREDPAYKDHFSGIASSRDPSRGIRKGTVKAYNSTPQIAIEGLHRLRRLCCPSYLTGIDDIIIM